MIINTRVYDKGNIYDKAIIPRQFKFPAACGTVKWLRWQ
ncbi:hypothetical protein CJA_1305 [Cellvibrio japonicus Ueda107]|uniref:Uncharacterized protein n=1 Tax=Cellvibrio japonicus (strain Ueda107) TaxID=498211 RepID=B3PCI8_CELJU|nr:hypothetical protein CJA_1305 [Cellvibrio japonicus Ueda107]